MIEYQRNYDPTNSYEDDIDSDEDVVDPFMDEASENPAEEIGIPDDAYREGLDDVDVDEELVHENEEDFEDRREQIEDLDEDDDNSATPAAA